MIATTATTSATSSSTIRSTFHNRTILRCVGSLQKRCKEHKEGDDNETPHCGNGKNEHDDYDDYDGDDEDGVTRRWMSENRVLISTDGDDFGF